MELKQLKSITYCSWQHTSNCTNMELKPDSRLQRPEFLGASNCTNMELKQGPERLQIIRHILLIAPIWNWNFMSGPVLSEAKLLLIAPIWNWNCYSMLSSRSFDVTSNCTNMELKRLRCSGAYRSFLTSNCTNMELKLYSDASVWCCQRLLIAPIWNWNLDVMGTTDTKKQLLIAPIWNWNNFDSFVSRIEEPLLIAPIWNWNRAVAKIWK